ncbi:18986_t:CDS:1, partial [Gigaspora margarita]
QSSVLNSRSFLKASKAKCSDKYMNNVDNICNNEFKVNEDINSDSDHNDEDNKVVKKRKCKKSVIYYNKRGKSGSGRSLHSSLKLCNFDAGVEKE